MNAYSTEPPSVLRTARASARKRPVDGFLATIYPARSASRLTPTEVLRYE